MLTARHALLLERLGLRNFAFADSVERCAKMLHARAQQSGAGTPTEETRWQSRALVDAIFKSFVTLFELRREIKAGEIKAGAASKATPEAREELEKELDRKRRKAGSMGPKLLAASQLQVALAYPAAYGAACAPHVTQLAAAQRYGEVSKLYPRPPSPALKQQLRLRPLHQLLLTAAVEAACWSQHDILARDCNHPVLADISKYAEELRGSTGCYLAVAQLPDASVAAHLAAVCSVAPSSFRPFRRSRRTPPSPR
jgi:hypothetical protein